MPAIIMLHGCSCSLGTIAACSMWTVTFRDSQECPSRLVCITRRLVLDTILPLARSVIGSPADERRAGQGATFALMLIVFSRDSFPRWRVRSLRVAQSKMKLAMWDMFWHERRARKTKRIMMSLRSRLSPPSLGQGRRGACLDYRPTLKALRRGDLRSINNDLSTTCRYGVEYLSRLCSCLSLFSFLSSFF